MAVAEMKLERPERQMAVDFPKTSVKRASIWLQVFNTTFAICGRAEILEAKSFVSGVFRETRHNLLIGET